MNDKNLVVCGWYTPDYEHWFRKLELSLIEHGAAYDFQAVPKIFGGWERNTCRKAGFARSALDRHPSKTVIFLDVDCVVTGDLGSLADLPCDVALDFIVSSKRGRVNCILQTGHIIMNQTFKMRELLEVWANISERPEFGLNDQETLALAIGQVDGICLMHVGKTSCIRHASASSASGVRKVNGHARFRHRVKSSLAFWK